MYDVSRDVEVKEIRAEKYPWWNGITLKEGTFTTIGFEFEALTDTTTHLIKKYGFYHKDIDSSKGY